MSDENRQDDEIEAHDPVGFEGAGLAPPEVEAAGGEEPDFEAHGPVGLGPKRMIPVTEVPTSE